MDPLISVGTADKNMSSICSMDVFNRTGKMSKRAPFLQTFQCIALNYSTLCNSLALYHRAYVAVKCIIIASFGIIVCLLSVSIILFWLLVYLEFFILERYTLIALFYLNCNHVPVKPPCILKHVYDEKF